MIESGPIVLLFAFVLLMTLVLSLVRALHADALSVLFVTLSTVFWLVTTVYAIGYLENAPHRSRFFGFFSLCVTATVGLALAGDLFTFVVFYRAAHPRHLSPGVPCRFVRAFRRLADPGGHCLDSRCRMETSEPGHSMGWRSSAGRYPRAAGEDLSLRRQLVERSRHARLPSIGSAEVVRAPNAMLRFRI